MISLRQTLRIVYNQPKYSRVLNGIFCHESGQIRAIHGFREQDPTFATKVIHAALDPDQWPDSKPVVLPINMSTTFKQDAPSQFVSCEYSRIDNPTRKTVENVVAALEGAKYGIAYGSGMAAISTVFNLLKTGDHIVTSADLYGGTKIYLNQVADRLNIQTTFVADVTDPIHIENAIQENTKLIWIESPSNPTLVLVDIEKVAKIAHSHNIILATDNTFLSPYFQRPLELGADIVVHSATKYLNGHSDVLMGIALTNCEQIHSGLRLQQTNTGAVPSPFECFLLNRGIKTLPVRMRQHMENGLAVGRFLENHPCVERVLHPGLPSHPQHELAKRQSYGHSGMVTFFLKGGKNECRTFAKGLEMIYLAESLGGYESLLKIPALMPESYKLNVPVNLMRLSVGLEYAEDIMKDLDQALRAAVQ